MFVVYIFSVFLVITSAVEKRESRCYPGLSCFVTMTGFKALPQEPAYVRTQYLLYTRQTRNSFVAFQANASHSSWTKSLESSQFKRDKPTKFIIHGFTDNGFTDWVEKMKDALLTQGDYNIFVVDWNHGAKFPYEQATANVFLVAEQTKQFIQNLHSAVHVNLDDIHLIGHSLGAQMTGNIGGRIKGIGRISGLDPAQPHFQFFDKSYRLDPTDAKFVDVIHSDGTNFSGLKGYGWIVPQGHVDFYPNGGKDQPGCSDNPLGSALNNLFHGLIQKVTKSISCSHGRSHDFFLESITSSCQFKAHKCHSWSDYEAGKCSGCSSGCPQMGFNVDQSTRGSFYLSTSQKAPYCGTAYYVELTVSSDIPDCYGKFYITINGQHGSTGEVEFTRSSRFYTNVNKTEKHIIAVAGDVGHVFSIQLKFQKGSGLASLGTSDVIKVQSVSLKRMTDNNLIKFCDNGTTLFESDKQQTFSHTC